MTTVLGIVCQEGDIRGVLRLLDRVRPGDWEGRVLVALTAELAQRVEAMGHRCRSLDRYGGEGELHRRSLAWFDHWAEAPLVGGPSFIQRFASGGLSYWWFLRPLIFPDVRRCVRLVDSFTEVYDEVRPDLVAVADPGSRPVLPFRLDRGPDVPARIAGLVARSRGLQVQSAPSGWRAALQLRWTYCTRLLQERVYAGPGEQWLGRVRVLVAGPSARRRWERARAAGRWLLHLSTPAYWRTFGDDSGIRDDVFAGALLRRIAARPTWQVLDVDTEINLPSLAALGKLREKTRRPGIHCLPIEALYTRALRRRARAVQAEFRRGWNKLRSEPALADSLQYRGTPLWPLLKGRFDYALNHYSGIVLRHREAVTELMRDQGPAVVTMEFEEGSYGRAAIAAGQRLGIPTLALQHGIHIDPYICSYFYGRTASSASDDLRACPVATRTALFGEVTQRQLTEISAYAPQALAVTGSAAFDPLAAAVEQLDRDTCRADLGLPAEGRVVTIMANRFWGPQYWRWFVTTLFDALAQLPQWRTVIKLHPHDAPDGYLQASARVGLENPLIMRDRLWPAIVAADAVVACYTTTILDAMALSRPVVFPRIPGMEDSLGFAESGGVIAVDDVDQLVAALQRLDEDPAHLAAQVEGAFPVLEEHLHRVDGRASERLALLADELSGTSRPSAPPVVAPSEVGEHV